MVSAPAAGTAICPKSRFQRKRPARICYRAQRLCGRGPCRHAWRSAASNAGFTGNSQRSFAHLSAGSQEFAQHAGESRSREPRGRLQPDRRQVRPASPACCRSSSNFEPKESCFSGVKRFSYAYRVILVTVQLSTGLLCKSALIM
jgi:hypothetical protein